MNVQRIPAVIIQTPNSERFLPLFEVISESEVFEPVLIVATMGYSFPVIMKTLFKKRFSDMVVYLRKTREHAQSRIPKPETLLLNHGREELFLKMMHE